MCARRLCILGKIALFWCKGELCSLYSIAFGISRVSISDDCHGLFWCQGKSWLAIADRFSGWLSLFYFPREASSQELINTLKNYFSTYGIAEQVASDDGQQFRSNQFKQFLSSWGVGQHRVSSSYHPHSNLRTETAVKSGKRLLLHNNKTDGSPKWDRIIRAMM